jgi:prophage regulatory protein
MSAAGTPARYVRWGEVLERSGLSRRTIFRRMADGSFPASVKLSEQVIAWPVEAFDEWMRDPVGYRVGERVSA